MGSPRQMLGQDKSFKARYDFSPYGELMRSAGLPLTVGYTGHAWDPAISQYFAPFRYYSPQTARWNMRDPLGMIDGPNLYAYVAGTSVMKIDPLGLVEDSVSACARNNPVQFWRIVTGRAPNQVGGTPLDLTDISPKVLRIVKEGFEKALKGHKKSYMEHLERMEKALKKGDWEAVRDMQNQMKRIAGEAKKARDYVKEVTEALIQALSCDGHWAA